MHTNAEPSRERKSSHVEETPVGEMTGLGSSFQFQDNRPETVAQRKRQAAASNSPQVQQLQTLQRKVNDAPPGNDAPIQRVVDKGLKAKTEVETLDGTLVWVVREMPGGAGYMVVNPSTRKTEILAYDKLNPKGAAKPQLPKDHLVKRFDEHAALGLPSLKMAAVTGDVDAIFAEAAAKVPHRKIPWVDKFSWLALGSYGRAEMCPYSDVEFGITYTIKEGEEQKADHRTIKAMFGEIGSAILETMQKGAACIVKDTEGNYPGGKGGNGLMGSPDMLAHSIAVAHAKEAVDARNTMLMDARYIAAPGSHPGPFEEFQQQKQEMLMKGGGKQAAINGAQVGLLAEQTLVAGLKDRGRYINIKKSYRQPLDWALMALCISRGIVNAVGFKARTSALLEAQVIDKSLADLIDLTYEMIFLTRIDMHGFHGEELDVMDARPQLEEDTGGFSEEKREEIGYYGGKSRAQRLEVLYIESAEALLALVQKLRL